MRLGRGKTILFIIVVAGALPLLTADLAWSQTPPCDFVTGGGFIVFSNGAHGNFGVGGGCKQGSPTWGHLEYVDHGSGLDPTAPTPFNVHGTGVTGYFFIDPMTRDIRGTAETNDPNNSTVTYCVEVTDNGEGQSGTGDLFRILLSNGYFAFGTLGGGNIQLHKGNPPPTGACFGGPK